MPELEESEITPEERPKRGRPRKAHESAEGIGLTEVAADTLEPVKRGRKQIKRAKKRPEIGLFADMSYLWAFSMMALVTGHEHWRKTPEEVRFATEHLQAYIEDLPPALLKKIEKNGRLWFLGLSTAMLVIPDAIDESKLRRAEAMGGRRQGPPTVYAPRSSMPESPISGGSNGSGQRDEGQPVGSDILAADPALRGLDL